MKRDTKGGKQRSAPKKPASRSKASSKPAGTASKASSKQPASRSKPSGPASKASPKTQETAPKQASKNEAVRSKARSARDVPGGSRPSGSQANKPPPRRRWRARWESADANDELFPIVGIGASAGGLEALEEFFKNLPPDSGMAFVVVTHKHPGHVSILPELLGRCTEMPVAEATDGVRVKPDHVYLAPAEHYLAILKGWLHFMAPAEPAGLHLPVDHFFRSLAEDQGDRAIGIILSGTGTDGTLGVVAIKGEAGAVMAQDADSAKYAGMPRSAASAAILDFVEPPAELAKKLVAYAAGVASGHAEEPEAAPALPEVWQKAFVLLRNRTGHDFSSYKASTVRRRFERRMNVHQLERPEQYVRYLEQNSHELDILFRELLIGVTSFFRDPATWEALHAALVPLLAARTTEEPFRVWVVGCSTGEEAYTIGIVLREAMEEAQQFVPVQIFATDIDAEAIETARVGRYPVGIAADVKAERLKRYFVREDNRFRINKDIREMIVFAPQNVIKDPPFTKLDLLSCRNLLIYLEQNVQKQLLPLFHYALRNDGMLVLGPSETTSGFSDLFAVVDKKWRLFRRKEAETDVRFARGGLPHLPPLAPQDVGRRRLGEPVAARLSSSAERMLMAQFVPPAVIINGQGDIAYIHGRTGAYLEPAAGEPTHNAYAMAREGLRLELPALVRQAGSQDDPVVREGVRVRTNGGFQRTRVSVQRIHEPEAMRGLFLVAFEPEPEPKPAPRARKGRKSPDDVDRVHQLENELQRTKENLQGTIEELETSNEELKSTNEELQSTNEELQSANEELETSKEEMQSLNEELQTVNAELQSKMEDLSRANDDMQNLLNSTEIATIFLDNDLRIKRFTEQAKNVIRVIDSDIGRPIGDLAHHLQYEGLVDDAREVLRTLDRKEREVQTKEGAWRLMRVVPYRTGENVIDGLVITLIDIDNVKRAEREAREAQALAEEVVQIAGAGLVVLDGDLQIISANAPFCHLIGRDRSDVVGRSFFDLDRGRWNAPSLRDTLERTASEGGRAARVKVDLPEEGRRLVVTAQRVEISPDEGRVVLAVEDAKSVPIAPLEEGGDGS